MVSARREKPGQRLYARVQEWLVAALGADKTLPALQRAAAGRILARLDDPRFDQEHWYLPKEDWLGFLRIPGGPFSMGTDKKEIPGLVKAFGGDKDWYKDETPKHTLSLPGFYLGRFPVTNAQFQAFVDAGGYNHAAYWIEAPRHAGGGLRTGVAWSRIGVEKNESDPDNYGEPFNLANHPVVGVTWYEALAYSRWLDDQLRSVAPLKLQALDNQPPNPGQIEFWQGLAEGRLHVRLPSEAEWERAARSPDSRQYPWGSDYNPEKANTYDTDIGTTSAVGCFQAGASAEGAQDLAGNVWEWTRSLYGTYPYPANNSPDQVKKREDLDSTVPRVLRGGAFDCNRRDARSASRCRAIPATSTGTSGFAWWSPYCDSARLDKL